MRKMLFFVVALVLLSGCAQIRFVSWDLRRVEVPGQNEKLLDMATTSMNSAIQSRDYLLLYNAVYNNGIPAAVLAKLDKSDRVAVIASERDTLEYADFMHLFVSAYTRYLVNNGYKVVDLRPAGRKYGLENERLMRSLDKLLVFTVWEAGNRSIFHGDMASVFSAFQVNMDVVEAKSNLMLASLPVFGSIRSDFDRKEYDRFQMFTLSEVNSDLPLIYADTRIKGAVSLSEVPQGREFVLTVFNPVREEILMKITDLNGNTMLEKEISFKEDSSGGYYSHVWDGKLSDGSQISMGEYFLSLRDSSGMSIVLKRFSVN